MIYDVIVALDTELQSVTKGVNKRIAAVDVQKGTNTLAINEFVIWDGKKLPSAFDPPTLLVVWEGSRDMDLISQGKWNASHLISLQVFLDETDSILARKSVTIYAAALRSFIDYMADVTPILEIRDPIMNVGGWPIAGKHWVWLAAAARYIERDEDPLLESDL